MASSVATSARRRRSHASLRHCRRSSLIYLHWNRSAPTSCRIALLDVAPELSLERGASLGLEQEEHALGEDVVQDRRSALPKTQRGQHHRRVVHDLGAVRPQHLCELALHLTQVLREPLAGAGAVRLRGPALARACSGVGARQASRRGRAGPGAEACRFVCRFTNVLESRVSRAGGTRTPNRRFWRPVLYQLSYCPLIGEHHPEVCHGLSGRLRLSPERRHSPIADAPDGASSELCCEGVEV